MHLEANHETIESGMLELQERLTSQDTRISDLETENQHLKVTVDDTKGKLTLMTQDNIALRELNAALQDKLDHLQNTSTADVEGLRTALKEEKDKSTDIKKKADSIEAMYRGNIQMLQQEITTISDSMLKTARELDNTNKERDKARGELASVNERTRKLLFSLDLTKDIGNGDSSLSLDHARNMVYVRRRRGSFVPLGGTAPQQQQQLNGSVSDRSEPEVNTGPVNTAPVNTAPFNTAPVKTSPAKATKTQSRRGSYGTSRNQHGGDGTTPRRGSMGKKQSYSKQQQRALPDSPKSIAASTETNGSTSSGSTGHSKGGATARGLQNTDRSLVEQTVHEESEDLASKPINDQQQQSLKCNVCSKQFQEVSNFEGACVFHIDGATKLNVGTELEVWSCCKSGDTYKGCQKGRHTSLQLIQV